MASNTKNPRFIQLVYFGDPEIDVLVIGGAGFAGKVQTLAEWEKIPQSEVDTDFRADLLDFSHDILDEKDVTAQTCELLMGKPMAVLITEARARMRAEQEQNQQQGMTIQ